MGITESYIEGQIMSVFYCDWCDQLVDSDEAPDFIYHEDEGLWQCEDCLEADMPDI